LVAYLGRRCELGGQDSNLQHTAPKAAVLPIELPPKGRTKVTPRGPDEATVPGWRGAGGATRVADLMGSLIKKRRKRMRKKKHKKMLKRTRWQRRAAGK
jgi:Mitochondrial mRNA-processing protein COX24, C-terminal